MKSPSLLAIGLCLVLSPTAALAQAIVDDPPEPAPAMGPPDTRATAPGPSYGAEMRLTRERIEDARDARQITRRQAKGLRKEAHATDALAARYASDGLSRHEARELEIRARVLDGMTGAARARNSGR